MKTHYQLLGVSPHASATQIRDAYRHALEQLTLAQHYASYDELKIRRLVLREAYEALSASARRQSAHAAQVARRSALYQALDGRVVRRSILWLLMTGMLTAAVYAYLGAQQVTAAVPNTLGNMSDAGPVQAFVPASGPVREARWQAGRKAQMRRNMLAEKLHAQQLQQESLLPLTAQLADEVQQSESGINNDGYPARQSMYRLPGRN